MRQVREIVRLSLEAGLSTRVIGERIGVGPTTVRDTLKRFAGAGLAWPVPEAKSDAELEQLLYGVPGVKPGRRKVAEPDWSMIARELKRKHVTLQVLWDEYIAEHSDGYRHSRFCDLFRNWEGRLPLVMRQHHGGWREIVCRLCRRHGAGG
jgi:transposase